MVFDQSSFLIAIGLVAAAVAVTTLVMWSAARAYGYLLCWGGGLAASVPGVALLGAFMSPYHAGMNFVAYVLVLTGVVLIAAGATQFRTGSINVRFSIIAWMLSVGTTGAAFAFGLSGLGVVALNIACGALFMTAAVEFWRARGEAAMALSSVAALYALLALSFVLCVIPIAQNGQYVLHARQENWAENLNSICILISLAGIGAMMLLVAQNRATQVQRRAAMSDPLTGLLNRRALFDQLAHAPLGPASCAIMFDLDHFKRINDRFGHAIGDEVLVRFAKILRECVRGEDIVARMGGEEFCVFMRDLSALHACELAERICVALATTNPLAQDSGPPTVSAGVAANLDAVLSFEALLLSADAALYLAKNAGRNRVQGPPPRLVA